MNALKGCSRRRLLRRVNPGRAPLYGVPSVGRSIAHPRASYATSAMYEAPLDDKASGPKVQRRTMAINITGASLEDEWMLRAWLAQYPRKPRKLQIRVVQGMWACHATGGDSSPSISIGKHPSTWRAEVFWHELDHHFGWHYATPSPWNPAQRAGGPKARRG